MGVPGCLTLCSTQTWSFQLIPAYRLSKNFKLCFLFNPLGTEDIIVRLFNLLIIHSEGKKAHYARMIGIV